MRLARRLYLYFIAAVSISVLAVAATNLLELLFTALHDAFAADGVVRADPDDVRRALSIYVSLTIVALPIWLVHWWLIERDIGRNDDTADEERRSDLRALYLSAGLAIPFIIWTVNGVNLLQRGFAWLLDAERQYYGGGVTTWLALTVVAGTIWMYHAWLRIRDSRVTSMTGASDWLPRLYRYAAAFTGVMLTIIGTAQVLGLALDALITDRNSLDAGNWWAPGLADALGRVAGGLLIWGLHWGYSLRLHASTDWRGTAERESTIRVVYLYLVALLGVFAAIILVSMSLQALFRNLLDVDASAEPLAYRVLEPIAYAIPFLLFWFYHRFLVLGAQDAGSTSSQATLRRIYVYLIAFVGLAVAGVGVAGTLQVVLDLALDRGGQVLPSDVWRNDIANFGTLAIVGSVVWLWHWNRVQAWVAAAPLEERSAAPRRWYLFAVLAGSVVALLVGLALVLYRILATILGVEDALLLADLSAPLAVLLVSGALLAYHGLTLRADLAARPADDVRAATVHISVSGPPGMSAEEIVAALRASVPDGFTVEPG
jgi:hypothetical protein